MPDAIFAHPRLAPVYDAFDGPRDDLDAYLAIAEELRADRVLDIGCGTGSLPVRLAAAGRAVIAVDPAAASLDVARAKDKDARVTWIHGDAAAAPPACADLAIMTGNVAQVFLTDEGWAQALQAIATALRPPGHLVFETRRPERRAWEEWAAGTAPVTLDVPGAGLVEHRGEVTAVDLPFVSLRDTYTFQSDGAVVTSESTLRFRGHGEVAASLAAAGYRILDVREAPDRPGREHVFITQHKPSTERGSHLAPAPRMQSRPDEHHPPWTWLIRECSSPREHPAGSSDLFCRASRSLGVWCPWCAWSHPAVSRG